MSCFVQLKTFSLASRVFGSLIRIWSTWIRFTAFLFCFCLFFMRKFKHTALHCSNYQTKANSTLHRVREHKSYVSIIYWRKILLHKNSVRSRRACQFLFPNSFTWCKRQKQKNCGEYCKEIGRDQIPRKLTSSSRETQLTRRRADQSPGKTSRQIFPNQMFKVPFARLIVLSRW